MSNFAAQLSREVRKFHRQVYNLYYQIDRTLAVTPAGEQLYPFRAHECFNNRSVTIEHDYQANSAALAQLLYRFLEARGEFIRESSDNYQQDITKLVTGDILGANDSSILRPHVDVNGAITRENGYVYLPNEFYNELPEIKAAADKILGDLKILNQSENLQADLTDAARQTFTNLARDLLHQDAKFTADQVIALLPQPVGTLNTIDSFDKLLEMQRDADRLGSKMYSRSHRGTWVGNELVFNHDPIDTNRISPGITKFANKHLVNSAQLTSLFKEVVERVYQQEVVGAATQSSKHDDYSVGSPSLFAQKARCHRQIEQHAINNSEASTSSSVSPVAMNTN